MRLEARKPSTMKTMQPRTCTNHSGINELSPSDRVSSTQAQRSGTSVKTTVLCLSLLCLPVLAPAQPTITLGNGIVNPAPNLTTTGLNPQQTAVADTAALVPVATFSPILQSTLTAQGFTGANNWSLVNNAVTLANNATFNLTTYNLFLNPGGDDQGGGIGAAAAGTYFGENVGFTLSANPPAPNVPGATVTLHWLQLLNENQKYGNFGYAINGQQGFWQVDNGDINGAAVSPTVNGNGVNNGNNGPYYDSNNNSATTKKTYSVPNTFFDSPNYYNGVGTYFHFIAIPTWDVYTPANGGNPATDTVDVANYGLSWGFSIIPVPEPSSMALVALGLLAVAHRRARSRRH
jgi:PEP-CTERM motif